MNVMHGWDEKISWTRKYMDTLKDGCFLYIEPGAAKDDDGKTVPRSKRHFPYRTEPGGAIDKAHLRNAIARIPQSNAPGLDDAKKAQLQARARRMLGTADDGKTYDEPEEWKTGAPVALLAFGYQLLDLAEDAVQEQKAMTILGEDTKGAMRLRPEVRARIGAVITDLGNFLAWSNTIAAGEDGKARHALLKQQLALTEV